MSLESSSKLIEIDWQPSPRHLRQFAVCLIALLLGVAYITSDGWRWFALGSALLVSLLAWLIPQSLRGIYCIASVAAYPFGMVIGELALLSLFVGVFLPIGLVFRWMRRDALQRKLDRDAVSYWEESERTPARKSYLRRY